MNTRKICFFGCLTIFAVGCGSSTNEGESGSDTGAITGADAGRSGTRDDTEEGTYPKRWTRDDTDPFAEVKSGQPRCFAQAYNRAHMTSHPKQTITRIAAELSWDTTQPPYLDISFTHRAKNHKLILVCNDSGAGETFCHEGGPDEGGGCPASQGLVLEKAENGLRVINEGGFRLDPDCSPSPKVLPSVRGGDDVFVIPFLAKCDAPE